MSDDKRVFFLELFGELPKIVGYYLMNHKEKTLFALQKELGMSKKEVAKSLSLLIHLGVVQFSKYGEKVKYSVREEFGALVDAPVYIKYAEEVFGATAGQLVGEVLVNKEIEESSVPEDAKSVVRVLKAAGVLVNAGAAEKEAVGAAEAKEVAESKRRKIGGETASGKVTGVSMVSGDKMTGGMMVGDMMVGNSMTGDNTVYGEKRYTYVEEKMRKIVVLKMFEEDIEQKFSSSTKCVFSIVESFHPMPAPLKMVLERVGQSRAYSVHGFSGSLEESVRSDLQYLVAYGALSFNQDRYKVCYEDYLHKMKMEGMLEYCRRHLEDKSNMILSVILSRGYVEDKFVQKHTLLGSAQCKKALVSLMSEGLVHTQMVPRTSDCVSSKSFHLWHTDMKKALAGLKLKVFEKLNGCYLEIKHLKENREYIAHAEYKHKTDQIYCALEHLHMLYFIARL